MTSWAEWLRTNTNGASLRAIANAIGKPGASTTINRWVAESNPPATGVVAIARAYGTDPIKGLIASGHLDEGDLHLGGVQRSLREATDLQLVEELLRRTALAASKRESFLLLSDPPTQATNAGRK